MRFDEIKNFSYFDILFYEYSKILYYELGSFLKQIDEKIIENIITSDKEKELMEYILLNNNIESVRKLFNIFNMYPTLVGNICKFLPLTLEQLKILDSFSIRKLILQDKISVQDALANKKVD